MISAFAIHRFLLRIALSSAYLFSWVLLYMWEAEHVGITAGLIATVSIFALSQVVVALATPLAARLYRYGMVRVMIFGLAALAAAITFLSVLAAGDENTLLVVGFGICMGIYRALYAVPYALMQGDFSQTRYLVEMLLATVPLIAGIAIAVGFAQPVLIVAAFAVMASILPLLRFEAFEQYEWSYRATFGMLMEPAHRGYAIRSLVHGAESVALFLAWPLFLLVVLRMDAAAIGFVMTLGLLLILIIRHVMHPVRDPATIAFLSAGAWVTRMAVAAPLTAVVAQAFTSVGRSSHQEAEAVHDLFADSGTFLDEVTVLKEVALSLGRILMAALFAVLLLVADPFVACGIVFAIAALCAVLGEYAGRSREQSL